MFYADILGIDFSRVEIFSLPSTGSHWAALSCMNQKRSQWRFMCTMSCIDCIEVHDSGLICYHSFCQHIYGHNIFVKNTSLHTETERGLLWEEWQSQRERRKALLKCLMTVIPRMCFLEKRVNVFFYFGLSLLFPCPRFLVEINNVYRVKFQRCAQ